MKDIPPVIIADNNALFGHSIPFLDYVQDLHGVDSPLLCAFILDMCRLLPCPVEEQISAKLDGWGKEISIMEGDANVNKIIWDVLFDPSRSDESMLPELPPNPYAARYCHLRFSEWRDKMSRTLHYPRMTFKNLPRATREDIENHGWDLSGLPIVGQINLERMYQETGYHAKGGLELRQRWYVSNVKPRTYFAQGGITYESSKHLQGPFTELADMFPFTEKKTCLRPSRIFISQPSGFLRIYDLEAFTSRMTEQRGFLDSLSKFCSGYPFSYMDSARGVITRDFGEVLWDYNQSCNHFPEVTFERAEPIMHGIPSYHRIAGPLGVFGNLVTCKVAHGALVLQIVDHEDQLNCAGDDGALDSNVERDKHLNFCIDALGRDQEEKRFRSDELGCICLKRPLTQSFSTIRHHLRIIPPSLYNILHHGKGYTDPRYRHFGEEYMTLDDHRKVIATEVFRFTRSVYLANEILTVEELEVAFKVIEWIQQEFRFPIEGCLAGFGSKYTFPMILDGDPQGFWSFDPILRTAYNHYRPNSDLPKRGKSFVRLSEYSFSGAQFQSNSSPHLKFLEQLGFVEKEKALSESRVELSVEEYVSHYIIDYVPAVYCYTVVRDIPPHLLLE